MSNIYTYSKRKIESMSELRDIRKNQPSQIFDYYKNDVTIREQEPIPSTKQFKDLNWVAFGDSLTDPTAAGGNARRYDYYLNALTGIHNTNLGMGGTGYRRTFANGTAFSQRANASSDINSSTDIVTVFGSINDQSAQNEGVKAGKSGPVALSFNDIYNGGESAHYKAWWFTKGITTKTYPDLAYPIGLLDYIDYDETFLVDSPPSDATFVGYVNAMIDVLHRKAPNAKVVLVSEIFASNFNTYTNAYNGLIWDVLIIEMMIKQKIVSYRRSVGDTWLSHVNLWDDNYAGIYGSNTSYCIYPGVGLSSKQCTKDVDGYNFAPYRNRYFQADQMHPNRQYNYEWLAPKFGAIICDAMGISKAQLPSDSEFVAQMTRFPELSQI